MARVNLQFVACEKSGNTNLLLSHFFVFKLAYHKTTQNPSQSMMFDSDDNMANDIDDEDAVDDTWLPRRSIRDTNWMYRVDALCIHDHREMELKLHYCFDLL